MFVIGWMIQCMRGSRQVIVTFLCAVAILALLMRLDMTVGVLLLVSIALVLLAFDLNVRVPRDWARALNQLASMTLYVYLVHQFVIHFLNRFDLPQPIAALAALCVSFAVAAVIKRAFDAVDGAVFGYRSRRPSGIAPSSAVL